MAAPRGTDEALFNALPTVGIFLTLASVPISADPANIVVEALNEGTEVSGKLTINVSKKVTDGFYALRFAAFITLLVNNSVFAIVVSSGTTTIDTQLIGRFRIVEDLAIENTRIRQEESAEKVAKSIQGISAALESRIDESSDNFTVFDEKITKGLNTVNDAVKDVNSTLSILRRTGGQTNGS